VTAGVVSPGLVDTKMFDAASRASAKNMRHAKKRCDIACTAAETRDARERRSGVEGWSLSITLSINCFRHVLTSGAAGGRRRPGTIANNGIGIR
jgi:hypothetical protein